MDDTGARDRAGNRLQGARDRWGKPIAVGLSVVIGAIGVGFFIAAGNLVGWTRTWFDDLGIYTDATSRVLAGGGWYLDRQLHGPYVIQSGDVLYPPVTAWFFLPWLVLPAWTFSVAAVAILAWYAVRARPSPWTWPLIVLCLVFPVSLIYIAFANPTVWIAAFVALGLRFGWPGVLVLLKPSLAPFALIGIRSRGWWIGLAALAVASLPVLGATLDYPRILLDSRGGGILYSLVSVPLLLVPILAWLGRRAPLESPAAVEPAGAIERPGQTRPETQ